MHRMRAVKTSKPWVWLTGLLCAVITMLSFAAPLEPAFAAPPAVCSPASETTSVTDLTAQDLHALVCEPGVVDLSHRSNTIRVDIAPGETPRYAISRTAKFAAMEVGVLSGDEVIWARHPFETITATFFNRQFAVPLPRYEGSAEAVFVRVERATQATTFDHLVLMEERPGSMGADVAILMIVSVLVGMMVMPIVFDLAAYRILRERFIYWHAVLVLSLVVQIMCGFGLYAAFADVTLPAVRLLTIGSFNLLVVAGVGFSMQFFEPDILSKRLIRVVWGLTAVFSACSLVHMAGIEALGHWAATVYFASGAPLGIALVFMLVTAYRKGSRSARFLIFGFTPLLFVAFIRIITFILPGVPATDANELMLAAMLVEVLTTALGVGTRFIALKRDRDRYQAEMDTLEAVAEHDPLTGLLNRRAIDARFEDLRRAGFDTFALIDLDHFKDVNDRFGHQVGDAVLKASARALRESDSENCTAIRIGGEEFVLLLRGPKAKDRAEAMRQAIPRRIAGDVPALDRLVTASMGVVELTHGSTDRLGFEAIYPRADALLYEAKRAGRNRMLCERLTLFQGSNRDPAKAAA